MYFLLFCVSKNFRPSGDFCPNNNAFRVGLIIAVLPYCLAHAGFLMRLHCLEQYCKQVPPSTSSPTKSRSPPAQIVLHPAFPPQVISHPGAPPPDRPWAAARHPATLVWNSYVMFAPQAHSYYRSASRGSIAFVNLITLD